MYGSRIKPSGFLPYRALTGWFFKARSHNCEKRLLLSSCLSKYPTWNT